MKGTFWVIIASVLTLSSLSVASVIVRPYGPVDYAAGTLAVGPKVNAEFENITSWLNGQNIGSDNIATGGVASVNFKASSLITRTFAAESVPKTKTPSNHSQSTGSGDFVIVSTGTTTVPGLSASITTSGRPVLVSLQGGDATVVCQLGFIDYGNVQSQFGNSTDDKIALGVVRDGVTISNSRIGRIEDLVVDSIQRFPCGSFRFVDFPSAGTHTYSIIAQASKAGSSDPAMRICNCTTVLQEL